MVNEIDLNQLDEDTWNRFKEMDKIANQKGIGNSIAFALRPTQIHIPRTFKLLKIRLNYLRTIDKNLREYGYNAEEIEWYHSVKNALIRAMQEYVV
jgi:hypothetical protein